MFSNANEGDRGVNIKPSARKGIHEDCSTCRFSTNMGRYGCYDSSRDKHNKPCRSQQSQGTDEVDNVMSKFRHSPFNKRPIPTEKNQNRSNSIDVLGANDSDDSDEDILSKSSPATFLLHLFSDDEQYRSATQNECNTSRDGFQSAKNSPSQTSPRNRQNTGRSTLESANISEPQINKRRIEVNSNETRTSGGTKIKHLGLMLIIVAVAIGVNSNYFSQSTDAANEMFSNEVMFFDHIRILGAKYKVGRDSILRLESGISTILKKQDAASFIFIYDSKAESFNSNVLYNFVEELALKTVKYLRNHSNSLQNVIVDTDQIETESELRALQSEVEKTGVMIVPNINNVPPELAMAFHYYCDEYNPLVKGSAIFFTLDAATCLHNNKLTHEFVEKCLSKKWNNIHKDKIVPLLNRVVNVVIDITNIMLL